MSPAVPVQADPLSAPRAIFYDYLNKKGLKKTQQREVILETFLRLEHHLNVDQLIERVREIVPNIGYATVYRTVNIFLDCGIAQEVRLNDEVRRIEPVVGSRHHDHLICMECGATLEFFNCNLEIAQIMAASKHGFRPVRHTLKIYGICRSCQTGKAGAASQGVRD